MTIMVEATRRRHNHAFLRESMDEMCRTARDIPALSPVERGAAVARIVEFLHTTLEPHAREEEEGLYPFVAQCLGDERATATMVRDHEAIRERVDALEFTDPQDGPRLQELLYGLYALVSVHLWKEEIEYLPLLDAHGLAYAPHPFAG
jgi:iron-sulfur cluster repair protein YtfE (RIC family)